MKKAISNLRKIRKSRGIKQQQLAVLTGMAKSTICLQELRGIKTIRVAKRYARALNCDPLEIIEL